MVPYGQLPRMISREEWAKSGFGGGGNGQYRTMLFFLITAFYSTFIGLRDKTEPPLHILPISK
jgi:hypothetical protein